MKRFAFFLLSVLPFSMVYAGDGVGTTAGTALFRISSARASAVGEAFTAMNDDITALEFNPGSLSSLESGQVSLQHEAGLADDAFSKALLGIKTGNGSLGLSIGRYDSGSATLYDGTTQRSVTAEEDWIATLGYGRPVGKFGLGGSVRYLSSRLADSYSASAFSLDAGLQIPIFEILHAGVSGPLVQSKLKYSDEEENLPKVYRAGLMADLKMNLATGPLPIKLLLDFPYDSDAQDLAVAVGGETLVGPLSLRAGYNQGRDANNLSLGAGFAFSRINIDYSFGFADNGFDSLHRVSFSMHFNQ